MTPTATTFPRERRPKNWRCTSSMLLPKCLQQLAAPMGKKRKLISMLQSAVLRRHSRPRLLIDPMMKLLSVSLTPRKRGISKI
uniref:Ku70-like family protein n=1 Tax=Rhizophora mucronata TaxID=61149 RepID=A0A2P2J756_RHIMU